MTDNPRCDACAFYEGPTQSDEEIVGDSSVVQSSYKTSPGPMVNKDRGICHGAPPTANPSDENNYGRWPRVKADDWCGQYQDRA